MRTDAQNVQFLLWREKILWNLWHDKRDKIDNRNDKSTENDKRNDKKEDFCRIQINEKTIYIDR